MSSRGPWAWTRSTSASIPSAWAMLRIVSLALALAVLVAVPALAQGGGWSAPCGWSSGCTERGALVPPGGNAWIQPGYTCPGGVAAVTHTPGFTLYVDGVITSTTSVSASSVYSLANTSAITGYISSLVVTCTSATPYQITDTANLGDLALMAALFLLVMLQIVQIVRR